MTLLKNRTTIHNLQKAGVALLTGGIVMLLSGFARPASEISDKDRLGMALEYFQSGKYHEAILLFGKLDKGYRLNPRFKAYMGVCYFYETDYTNACKCFNEAIPQLESFAPHERSVYYYMAAQSLFMTEKYAEAIPLYESALNVCYENEKGDALFGIVLRKDGQHRHCLRVLQQCKTLLQTLQQHSRQKRKYSQDRFCNDLPQYKEIVGMMFAPYILAIK